MENENAKSEIDRIKKERSRIIERRKERFSETIEYGLCKDFCPYFESLDRRINNDIDDFEETALIKKHKRSAAGEINAFPEDIRTIETLEACFQYLLDFKIDKKSFIFLENRMRAIKKDILVQKSEEISFLLKKILLLQKIIRWYIVSIHIIYNYESSDLYLIFEQVKNNISSLFFEYSKINDLLINLDNLSHVPSSNTTASQMLEYKLKSLNSYNLLVECNNKINEFIGYSILINLDSSNQYKYRNYNDFYIKSYLSLYNNYRNINLYKIYRNSYDFMKSCILLYWDDIIKRRVVNVLQCSLQGKVKKEYIDDMIGFDSTLALESFYYEIQDEIDFSEQKKIYREMKRDEKNINMNYRAFITHGNIDWINWIEISKVYLKILFKNVRQFKKAKMEYIKKIINTIKANKKRINYNKKIVFDIINENYKTILKKIIIINVFLIKRRKLLIRMMNSSHKYLLIFDNDIYKNILSSKKQNMFLERFPKNKKFYSLESNFIRQREFNYAFLDDFNEELGLYYDCIVFITKESKFSKIKTEFSRLPIVFLNETDKLPKNEILSCKKIIKTNLSELLKIESSKIKIDRIMKLRKYLSRDISEYLKMIFKELKFIDEILYLNEEDFEKILKII